jgi:hypothetical protein
MIIQTLLLTFIFTKYVINYVYHLRMNTQALVSLKKIYVPSSSLLQGKYLPFSPSPLRLNIFRLFVILSLTQLYRYTPEIFLFSTATFKYTYRAPLRRIGQEYSANVAWTTFQSLKRMEEAGVPGEDHRTWASNWHRTLSLAAASRMHPFVIYTAGREPTPYW